MKPACKILIFRLFGCRFNDVVNLDNIITLSDDFKFGYFVGLAVKFAYDAGVVSTGQIKVINLIKRQSKMRVTEKQKLPHYRSSHCILFRCYFISGPL